MSQTLAHPLLQDSGHGPAQPLARSQARAELSPGHGCHLGSQTLEPGWTPLSPRCSRDGHKCPGRCWCCQSLQSHSFLLSTASPAILAGARGELPGPRLSHGVVFGAGRGELSPGAAPTLPSLCWGHEWGWQDHLLGLSSPEGLWWSYHRRISSRSCWGRSAAGLPREVLQPRTGQVTPAVLPHSCWGSQAHGVPPEPSPLR